MLSRTADHLFWMARYIERAENTARVLDITHKTSLLPDDSEGAETHLWYAPLNIAGCAEGYLAKHELVEADAVNRYIALDPDNPSSIYSCLMSARENARSVRGAINAEMWESINASWLEINRMIPTMGKDCPTCFFEWVKERSHLFRGVTLGTMLKDDALNFIRLGTFLERADNTARILDVKYHILLPSVNDVGGAADYYQWGALLKSVSAFDAYRKVYRDVITPQKVAELLILRADMPRSLHACLNEVETTLEIINGVSGREARRRAGELHAALHFARIEDITRQGLHEYLTEFLEKVDLLGQEIHTSYLARREEFAPSPMQKMLMQVQ
jgi:uncharacterized alpha-E superfamily protein